jgi:hypothetical protein
MCQTIVSYVPMCFNLKNAGEVFFVLQLLY